MYVADVESQIDLRNLTESSQKQTHGCGVQIYNEGRERKDYLITDTGKIGYPNWKNRSLPSNHT